jgi:4-methylaminobutanoate oxidase (formaldehyde-forming)
MGEDQREFGWNKPPFFERMGVEHKSTRERVTLFDLTSFGKIEISGAGALKLMQRLCDNNVDKPVGSAIYTQFLNPKGGIQSDLTITRMADDCFWAVTGSGFIGNDLAWIRMHVEESDGEVTVRDITQEYACLALWGPKARLTLEKITKNDVSNAAHPYLTTKLIQINGAGAYAQRVSYAGELGWELYVPYNRATMVFDMLMEAGKEFGIEVGGYKVLDSLRLEKGYRYFTTDITVSETPYEGGLGFCVDLNKGDFIGRDALVKRKAEGITRKLCTLVLTSKDDFTQIYGGEAIYHEGKVLTRVRSGGYGFSLNKNILYAYLPIELAKQGNRFTVDLIEGRQEAEVTATVLFDPKAERAHA